MEKRFISISDLETYLGVRRATIYGWVWLKKIPYHKFGRKVLRFDIREIDQWAAEQKTGPR